MSERARRRATYDDVLNAPAGFVAQIIDGTLELQPRPARGHAIASSELGIELGSRFGRGRRGPGGWILVDEPEVHFGDDVLVPDLAGWRVERMPRLTHGPYFTLVPDWVCEVLSPSTVRIDRFRKMQIYQRESVRHVWLVDPTTRTLEVYRLEADGWKRVGAFEGDGDVRAEPFDEESIDLGRLWIEDEPESG